ncbi:hypothetical protein [Chryseolinea serpens]|nr:hypothetical protein [Chryseolinea serpens]
MRHIYDPARVRDGSGSPEQRGPVRWSEDYSGQPDPNIREGYTQ